LSSARGLADDLKPIASEKGEADHGQVKGVVYIFVQGFSQDTSSFSQWHQDVTSQFYYRLLFTNASSVQT